MGFLIWLPVVFAVKALFSSGKGGGKAGKKKKEKRKTKSHLCASFANAHTACITNNAGKQETLIISIFLISVRPSNVIDHYLPVSFPEFLSSTLVLCHGSAKLFFQFLDFPFVVSDQAVLLCVVLLE